METILKNGSIFLSQRCRARRALAQNWCLPYGVSQSRLREVEQSTSSQLMPWRRDIWFNLILLYGLSHTKKWFFSAKKLINDFPLGRWIRTAQNFTSSRLANFSYSWKRTFEHFFFSICIQFFFRLNGRVKEYSMFCAHHFIVASSYKFYVLSTISKLLDQRIEPAWDFVLS